MHGLILYGPPAVGKDTITEALSALDPRYVLFPRIKVGTGRVTGYRTGTLQMLEQLHGAGDVIWENRRYGATHVVDRPELTRRLDMGIPVLHLGKPEGIPAVVNAIPAAHWIVVDLYCARSAGIESITARGTGDTDKRIAVWDETPRLSNPDISIDTGKASPSAAARLIHAVPFWA